ncbi:monomethylamine transporter [Methanococcoides sp. NM1]|uniref:monomethylamine transporter n=1 Tax=Methanococcoides sp. NM1 TaxID=1201013 RepID=UPI00108377DC|nr:monomethylamine transporter [Methanococcoides sp. NM1]
MVNKAKYHNDLRKDAGVIVLVLGLLYFSETFIFYRIISTTWDAIPEVRMLFPVYLVFLIMLLGIETIGCLRVYKSIKQHMFDFNYYD